jgi:multidrug efflux system outer membrane protein
MKRLALLVVLAAGCRVGPDYKRPAVQAPASYRGSAERGDAASLADKDWAQVFPDPALAELIRTALAQNQDLLIAAARIEQAEAQLGITRADQLPAVTLGLAAGRERVAATSLTREFTTSRFQGSVSASWELDFWGKFRRATEAARADLLAAEWNGRAVITSLIASLAGAYYQLLELDLQLEISKRTLRSRQESLEITRLQESQGAVSLLDVRQAEQLVYNAAQTIIDIERRTEQQENFISVLLARNPGPIPRGRKLTQQPHDPLVPAGLPSSLLQRRPDIQLQEARLIAANARIGVARAAFFPSISLTGSGGAESADLTNLFKGPSAVWNFFGSLTQPIFEGGRLRSGVKLAEAREKEALIVYQQTIQQAFREVSDALVAYRKNREFREQQELLASSTRDALALANQRYRGGVSSYLEVLDSNTRTFAAELGLAQAQLNELLALVQLYNALGGGWQAALCAQAEGCPAG